MDAAYGPTALARDFQTEPIRFRPPRYIRPDPPRSAAFVRSCRAGRDRSTGHSEPHGRRLYRRHFACYPSSQSRPARPSRMRAAESERMRAKQLDLVGQVSRQIAPSRNRRTVRKASSRLDSADLLVITTSACAFPTSATHASVPRQHPSVLAGRGPAIGQASSAP